MQKSALALALLYAGCTGALAAPPAPVAEPIAVRVFGGSDQPLGGAVISSGTGGSAMTDQTGLATLRLDGNDGTKFDLRVTCPAGFIAPSRPLQVTLRRGSKPPEYHATCKRTDRTVLVAIRTPGTSGMPIRYLDHEIQRTDDQGVALVSIDSKIGDTFTLTLDTSEKRFQYLRPQSPEVSFNVTDSDDLFTFEQKFNDETPKVYRAPPPKPNVPKQIFGGAD